MADEKARRRRTGRPPMYDEETGPALMERRIADYFSACDGTVLTDKDGNVLLDKYSNPVVLDRRPYTVAGLAYALGFSATQSLFDYEKKPAFTAIVTRAKLRIEQYAAERLYDRDGQKGAEFVLRCNFGWKPPADAQEEQAGVGIVILPPVKDGGGGA